MKRQASLAAVLAALLVIAGCTGFPGFPAATPIAEMPTASAPAMSEVAPPAGATAEVVSGTPAPGAQAGENKAAPGTAVLAGTVTYRERIALPPNAVITVQLADVSDPNAPSQVLAQQDLPSDGKQVPFAFALSYDPAAVAPDKLYALAAYITADNQLLWSTMDMTFVLTQGAPTENVALILTQVGGEAPAGAGDETDAVTADIPTILQSDPQFSVLMGLLTQAGLLPALGDPGPITIFAPTDAAFAALPEGAMAELNAKPQMLADILRYHVAPGRFAPADLQGLATLPTLLQGQVLALAPGEPLSVQNGRLVGEPIEATNGLVYPVDAVLLPAETFDMAGSEESTMGLLSGSVTYPQRIALPAGSTITVKLLDISRADAAAVTLGQQRIVTQGEQAPFAFEIPYDRTAITDRGVYSVQARIEVNGQLRFISTRVTRVLTGGAPGDNVEIVVDAVGGLNDLMQP